MASFPQGVEPVFIRRRDLPPAKSNAADPSGSPYSALDICLAAERTAGKETIYGAQDIKGLWRIYPLTQSARNSLLIDGISLRGHTVTLHDKNPFILKGGDGREIPATKLYISDIPLSCSDNDIETALVRIGCVMRSSLTLERMRDREGKLTRFVTGRRFAFINVPHTPLERFIKIGHFSAQLYYKEMPKASKKLVSCSRCLQPGHHVTQCQNLVTCKECRQSGHRSGDAVCRALSVDFNVDLPMASSQSKPLEEDMEVDKCKDWDGWEGNHDKSTVEEGAEQEQANSRDDLNLGEEDDDWQETMSEMDTDNSGNSTGPSEKVQVPAVSHPARTPSKAAASSSSHDKMAATYSKTTPLCSIPNLSGETEQSGTLPPLLSGLTLGGETVQSASTGGMLEAGPTS